GCEAPRILFGSRPGAAVQIDPVVHKKSCTSRRCPHNELGPKLFECNNCTILRTAGRVHSAGVIAVNSELSAPLDLSPPQSTADVSDPLQSLRIAAQQAHTMRAIASASGATFPQPHPRRKRTRSKRKTLL